MVIARHLPAAMIFHEIREGLILVPRNAWAKKSGAQLKTGAEFQQKLGAGMQADREGQNG